MDGIESPWDLLERLSPCTTARGWLRFCDDLLAEVRIPYFAVSGARTGPAISITAGVHGGEYPGPAAAIRLAREIDPSGICGSLVIVPFANPTAFRARAAFITPEDGQNLNRAFPGDPDGTFTQVLACQLLQQIIDPAGVLIDLHSGDIFETLSDHTGFYATEDPVVTERARRLACAFDVPTVLRFPAPDQPGPSITRAAVYYGKTVALVEIGCNGLLAPRDERSVVNGLINSLRIAGVLEDEPEETGPALHEPGGSVSASTAGLWRPEIALRDAVRMGDRLGALTDEFGEEIDVVNAPGDGMVLYYLPSLAANQGDSLVTLSCPVQAGG